MIFSLVLLFLFSYFLGSIPTAYLMGKYLKGIDIRQFGSGNPGATNVFRTVGKTAGIVTLLIDILKGFAPVFASLRILPGRYDLAAGIGLAAIAGHNWTLFLNFHGGKGVATSAGVFLALVPIPTLLALGFFAVGLMITQHVSVGSMMGALSLPLTTWIFTSSKLLTSLSIFCALLILYLHKKNIHRLIRGEEQKISFKE
ncbi:MAG: glycerol-3-phosphate 1-O-acyltransferase PlsY [Elusimicrobia bacterium]|nr:glycerol-3-phosphate 1-O-acyltransferase PlsY [Elusimicrobiota bacterium]MBI3012216.1 glycerol-3-phosphate 1-O-acyltransferase PlsY [Elusimicrobiota bacterium]